jgi:hypothetical protein
MTFFPRLMVGMYGGFLRLFPRKFQAEFREEMQGVFASAVKGAVRTGTLALLRLLFFEMLDFPINLVIEHFSQWRKEWSMKDTRHGIRPFRSAEMGALGLLIGYLIIWFGRWYLILPNWWYKVHIGIPLNTLGETIPSALNNALASALLGLMLCLSVSASSRITLRACFLMAGLSIVAKLICGFITSPQPFQIQSFIFSFNGNWQNVALVFAGVALAMIEGLFVGAGLGLAAGGWKSCWRFALKGMMAYGLGSAIGLTIYQLWISSGWLGWSTTDTVLIITVCIDAILAGGILGWMWGKENPVGVLSVKAE